MTSQKAGVGDLTASNESMAWRKSSFSSAGDCVEWLRDQSGVRVRDSKDPNGPVLKFTLSEWRAFVLGMKVGEGDA
jgi:hypothetical protein